MRTLPLLCLALPFLSVPASGIAAPAAANAASSIKAPGFAAVEACPFNKLKAAYDAAMTGADTLDVFAIDKEILTVCNERTTLLNKLMKGDRKLAKLLAPPTPVASADAAKPAALTQPKTTTTEAQATTTKRVPSAPAPATGKPSMSGSGSAMASLPAPSSPAPASCTIKYAMISLAAAPGQRPYSIGGVVDQTTGATYTVTAGDTLPGDYTVQSVGRQGITLRHGRVTELLPPNTKAFPVRAEGFYAEPVSGPQTATVPLPSKP